MARGRRAERGARAQARTSPPGTRNKYRALPTTIDGIRFASKREAHRFQELRLLEKAGVIRDLTLQPRFELVVQGVKICRYTADFRYLEGDLDVVEDSKGYPTRDYRIRAKLFQALHPDLTFRET